MWRLNSTPRYWFSFVREFPRKPWVLNSLYQNARSVSSFSYEWYFEFPSQMFYQNADYVNLHISKWTGKRSSEAIFKYNQDDILRSTASKKINNCLLFLFVLSLGKLGIIVFFFQLFFNSSPVKSKDWKTAHFEQFKSLGIKTCSLGPVKVSTIYWVEKNHSLPETHSQLTCARKVLVSVLQRVLFSVFAR